MNQDLQNLEIKVENDGTTPQGRLTATEWNILVAAVKSLDLTGGSADAASILQVVANAGYATQEWVTGTAKAYDSARLNGKSSSYYLGQQYYSTQIDTNSATRNHISHSYQWTNAPKSDIQSLLDISYSADWRTQLMAHPLTQSLYARYFYNGNTWSKWAKILDSENFSEYALPKVGGDITGTLNVEGRLTLNDNAIFKHASNPFLGLYSTGREEYWYVQGTSSGLKLGSTSANSITIDKSGVLQVLEELKVGNLSIKKSQDNTIYIDGNLVVSGAMTMFGKDTTTTPSIFDLLPIDNETIKRKENGQLYAVSGGGGVADSVAWANITGKPTWIGATKPSYKYSEIGETPDLSKYATQDWVTGKGYITSSASITGNAGSATKLASARTLWGRSFDGTADITGSVTVTTGEGYRIQYNNYDLRFIISGNSSNRGIWDNTNSEWLMYRSSTTNIIFPQGNIAIGSHDTPTDRLTVTGSIKASESLKLTATPTEAFADAQMLFAGGKARIGVTASGFMGLYANTFTFRPSSTTSASASSFTIDANANIATTGKLTLPIGSSNFDNASLWFGEKVRIGVNSSNSLGIFSDYAIRLNPDSGTTASTTKGLWILNSGFNGINISSPTQALHVNGKGIFADATNPWVSLQRNGVNWYLQVTSGGLRLGRTSANAVGIDETGNLQTPGAITMYYSSDKRLKENIRKVNASKTLMSLGGVFQYEYINDEVAKNSTYGGSHFGLIYQNVKGSALDNMCFEREDGMGALNYLDTNFISLIAGATMETISEVEKLKRKIRTLENKVKQLEGRA